MEEKVIRLKKLILILNDARNSYYNASISPISDYEYDNLFDELNQLEKETSIIMSNSPTQSVGYEVKSKLEKVTHSHPMLSLDKTKSIDELKKFIGIKKSLLMHKLDGLTILLTYENGELIKAETRGDGEIGEDVTHNAKVFSNIPLKIEYDKKLEIEGEAIITYDDFNKINSALPTNEKYKNPRNLVSGSVRQLDNKIAASRNIRFIVWKSPISTLNSFESRLNELGKLGFTIVQSETIPNGNCLDEASILQMKSFAMNANYPIDGLVVTYDDIAYGESLRMTGHHPKHSLAFKFYDEEVSTILRNVEWSMGKTGSLTPVAIFDTVEIDGTDVSRASLHNINILKDLQLGISDEITVYKANAIIPQIKENLTKSNTLKIPDTCPICGERTEIKQDKDTKVLYCTNSNCKGKLLGKLNNFVSKAGMDIDGLSEETLNKLITLDILHDFKGIYDLKNYADVIVKLDGFGAKSVDKLLKSIEHSRQIKLNNFLYALGIEGIGKSQSKIIAKEFDYDWRKFEDALIVDWSFTNLDGFGEVLNSNIYKWYKTRFNSEDIPVLVGIVDFQKLTAPTTADNTKDLTGLIFVITGKLNEFVNRDAAKEEIEKRNGKVSGSVSAKTSYLVNNDINSTTGKNKTAKELGIPIITENQLIEMIR